MENKFEKLEYIKAQKSDIDEIVKLNKLYIFKFGGLSEFDYKTEIFNLKTKIELRINRYQVIKSEDIKLGYLYCYKNGNDAVIEDLQLYPEYDCRQVIYKVLDWCRFQLHKDGDILFINNVCMNDKKRLSIYESCEFIFYKMASDQRAVMKWVWCNMWWM